MKHENEIVDSRVMMRIICGILALGGIWGLGSSLLRAFSEQPYDWAILFTALGQVFGIFMLLSYAASGRLPPFMAPKKSGGLA